MRALVFVVVIAALVPACGPPRAAQFVGADGSRDWWTVECRGNEARCWEQAKAACHDNFTVHETRTRQGATAPVAWTVHDGSLPPTTSIADSTLVLSCAAPTVAPALTRGPECSTSPPRPNHCDDAAGETFTTGRRYLAPAGATSGYLGESAKVAESAMTDLRSMTDVLEADIETLGRPIAAVDGVVKSASDFPRTFRMKAARVKALTKAALERGSVTVPSDVRVEAVDDMKALLADVRDTAAALAAVKERATSLLDRVDASRTRVTPLANKAREALANRAKDTGLSDAERKKAATELTEVATLEARALHKLEELRAKLETLPQQATGALARLRLGVS